VVSGGAGFSASHTYQARGTYTVTLTVYDNAGVFSTTQQTVTIAAGPGVTITSPSSGASVQSPVHVVATGLIAGGVSYMEVFLDNAATPAYTATGSTIDTQLQIAAGTHTLRIVAHDASSNSISSDVTFTVGAGDAPPNAMLNVEPFGGGNQVMACTATSTDADGWISGSKINFGDGVIASGPTALHTYASAGKYQVTATVTDNAGVSSTTSSSVTVGSTSTGVSGLVTNVKTGSALAGAKVVLAGSTTTSDSSGHYSFSNVSQGAYTLTASASGYLARSYNVSVTTGSPTTQNIALSTAGVLQGKVSNGSGVGVAGATVSITGGVLSSSFSATTNSSGSYNFGWVPVGTYAVTVTASGYGSGSSSATINSGQTTVLNVSLPSGASASLSGRVTSASDGHALAGATVSTGTTSTTTDGNGNYSFSSIAAGSYTLTATSGGRLPASATVTVTSGSQLVHNFQLSTAGVLKGKVSTSTGSAIAGARVTFTGGVFNTTNAVVTDASGNYNAGYIPIGSYAVSVTASGVTKTSSILVSSGATMTVNFAF
jgi:hypothetical protein